MLLLRSLLAILSVILVSGKLADYYVSFNFKNQWKYLTKFSGETGEVSWEGKFRYSSTWEKNTTEHTGMIVGVYSRSQLDAALLEEDCNEKLRHANYTYDVEIPNDGEWSLSMNRTFPEQTEVTFWYFTIASCGAVYENKEKLYFNIRMLNEHSELSYEDKGLYDLCYYLFGLFSVILARNLYSLLTYTRRKEGFPLQISLLIAAISVHLVSLICQLIHLNLYESNGYGQGMLNYGYLLLSEGSTLLVSHVLLTIASGWSLSYSEYPDKELVTPVCILIFILETIVVGLGKTTDDSHKKHSEFEGIMGYVMVGIRAAIGLWFLNYAKPLYKKLNSTRQTLLKDLSVAAYIFYFSLPVILVSSFALPYHYRKYFVLLGTHLSKVFIFCYFSWYFRESGAYFEQSTLSEGILQSKYN